MHKLRRKGDTEQSLAYKLFNERFAVMVQNKAFFTSFELEEIGFTSCGSVANNEIFLDEYRLVQTTLDKIAEWNARGDKIRLTNLLDATPMYRIMDGHMSRWLQVAQQQSGVLLPPIEDFEALDRLCEQLHPLVDININEIDDPMLLMMFGSALNLGFMLPDSKEDGTQITPYEPYSPKLYGHTLQRWEK